MTRFYIEEHHHDRAADNMLHQRGPQHHSDCPSLWAIYLGGGGGTPQWRRYVHQPIRPPRLSAPRALKTRVKQQQKRIAVQCTETRHKRMGTSSVLVSQKKPKNTKSIHPNFWCTLPVGSESPKQTGWERFLAGALPAEQVSLSLRHSGRLRVMHSVVNHLTVSHTWWYPCFFFLRMDSFYPAACSCVTSASSNLGTFPALELKVSRNHDLWLNHNHKSHWRNQCKRRAPVTWSAVSLGRGGPAL